MALITLDQAKTHLNISSGAIGTDVELQSFVDVACQLVQQYAGRTWDVGSVTQTFDGGGSAFLLASSPITSITSVTVGGVALAASGYTADLSAGIVRTTSPTWEDWQNVVIVYAVGAASPPAVACHAALETVRHLWGTQRGTVVRQTLPGDDYAAALASYSLPRRVMELLDPLRAVGG